MILLLMKLLGKASRGMKLGAGQGTYKWRGETAAALKAMKVFR